MSITVSTKIELNVIECANCGLVFAVTTDFERRRRNDHGGFYCPFGHSNYFPSKSDEEKLRDQLSEEKRKLANTQFELLAAKERTEAVEREKKRLEKRIKNGVCPCCHRQFTQLTRHMKTKHPEYQK